MRLKNFLFVLLFFLIPILLTYFTTENLITSPLSYGLWLTMEIGIFTSILYFINYRRSRGIPDSLLEKFQRYRVAAVVTSYNENHETVKDTLVSVKNALGDLGDVFLLDDSTDNELVLKNKEFCESNGIVYVHREIRRGYKAGALNDFLKAYGDKYDVLAIFDVDQRPVKSFFYDLLPFFNDPEVAFVQVPQAYTELSTNVALGSYYQQKPFNDIIMMGRNVTGSAFI